MLDYFEPSILDYVNYLQSQSQFSTKMDIWGNTLIKLLEYVR